MGTKLADLCKQSKVKVVCKEVETNALWGDRLAGFKVRVYSFIMSMQKAQHIF